MKQVKKILAIMLTLVLSISMIPTINVSAAKKVKLNKTKATIYVGKTVTLKLKNNKAKVKWSSSNKKIATVSKKGKVKGKKAGKATITAKVGKKKYKCKITVKKEKNNQNVNEPTKPAPNINEPTKPVPNINEPTKPANVNVVGVKLDKTAIELKENERNIINATVLPQNATNKKIVWSTESSWVAEVSDSGEIIAKNAGETVIRAKTQEGNYIAQCSVIVKAPIEFSYEEKDGLLNITILNNGNKMMTIDSVSVNSGSGEYRITPGHYETSLVLKRNSQGNYVYVYSSKFVDDIVGETVNSYSKNTITYGRDLKTYVNNGYVKVMYTYKGTTFFDYIYSPKKEESTTQEQTTTKKDEPTKVEETTTAKKEETTTSQEDYGDNGNMWLTEDTTDGCIIKLSRYYNTTTKIVIPNKICGKTVVGIGRLAFSNDRMVQQITIPNTVTSIGEGAFSTCTSLASITIPNSVMSIGDYAFDECSSLGSITIPNSVTSIGEKVFYNCASLYSVTISSGIQSIDKTICYSCERLSEGTIPSSVTKIVSNAFVYCPKLTSIKGEKGSYAEKWAKNKGYTFIAQ